MPIFNLKTRQYRLMSIKVLKQGIKTKTICPNVNYILEFRNTKSHLLQVYLGAWVKIEIVIENHVKLLVIVIIDFKRYPSTYCLMQGRCFICNNFEKLKKIFTSNI